MALNSEIYDGDILERALTSGIDAAALNFQVEREYVRTLVRKFEKEITGTGRCPCEQARYERGEHWMCMFCSGPIDARVLKPY